MSAAISIHDGKAWPNTGSPAAAALGYLSRGMHAIKLLPGGKNQAPGQIARRLNEQQTRQVWTNSEGFNVGIMWGPLSNWMVDVNLSPEARHAAAIILGPTATAGRDGEPDHWIFYSQNAENTAWRAPGDAVDILEIRAEGKHTVMPPSIHADTGQRVAWTVPESTRDAARMHAQDLADACTHVAIAVVLRRHWASINPQEIASALMNAGTSAFHVRQIFTAACGEDHADAIKALEQERGAATVHTVAKSCHEQVGAALAWLRQESTAEPAWGAALARDKYNVPKNTISNVMHILEAHPKCAGLFAVDTFTNQVLMVKPPPWPHSRGIPCDVEDSDTAEAVTWVAREAKLEAGIDTAFHAINATAYRNQFDSLVDYLTGLKWDGTHRIHKWLHVYLGAEDTQYTSEVGMRWLIAGAARGMRPGCKVDTMLVLEGPQGIGKSTALKILASPAMFTDHLPPISDVKEVAEALPGNWIVENGELDGIGKAETTRIKQFLATTEDKVRLSYGRRRVTLRRRCIFAGTTNDAAYLKDDTGNRRFWPVLCGRIDKAGLAGVRDQLWAEAMYALGSGAVWHLDATTEALAAMEQAARYEQDPWEDALAMELRNEQSVTSLDAFEIIEQGKDKDGHPVSKSTIKQRSKSDQQRMGKILRRLGFVRRVRRADGWHFERAE